LPAYLRCDFVRKDETGSFVVACKGKEIVVAHTDLYEDDDQDAIDAEVMDLKADESLPCGDGNYISSLNHHSAGSGSSAVPHVDPWAHVDWSDEAYARDSLFVLRAIASDFPRFELGDKLPAAPHSVYWPLKFFYRSGPNRGEIKFTIPLDSIDYGISFEPFCTQAFLPSLSAEQHARLMDTAAMRETFRCFFLHLAVELGVHPVALQVILHEAMLRCSPLIVSSPPLLVLKHSFSVAACVPRAMRCTLESDS
jgi:hypothetical protein